MNPIKKDHFFIAARAVPERPDLFAIQKGFSPLSAINNLLYGLDAVDEGHFSVWRLAAREALTPSADMQLLGLGHYSLRSFIQDLDRRHPEYQQLYTEDPRIADALHDAALESARSLLQEFRRNQGIAPPSPELWYALSAAAKTYIVQTFGERR
ncbi:MAG: hypothetical protein QUU85_03740 [Candidatus Eisenbacteria bacterium]|nr:hypothetical protein [Candidatus Eisenbacteria bacterium]